MMQRCRRRMFLWLTTAVLSVCGHLLFIAAARTDDRSGDSVGWYKGNTHCHTLWSDGDEFPEMVADWYKSHGYDFLAISDHDRLMAGSKWVAVDQGKHTAASSAIEKCEKRFGPGWLQFRDREGNRQVKLRTLDEVRSKLDEPDKFLLIQNEEISTKVGDHSVHINAINPAELLKRKTGRDVVETIALNLAMVREQSERLGRPILAQVNHPNFSQYDISPEDLAAAATARFVEVCNGHPGVRNLGDATHPGVEKLWDIANTIRIAKMKAPPLYAIGSDDAHRYHKFSPHQSNSGRAWIMVHAKELKTEALLNAISRGGFYASTGVTLRNFAYDAQKRTIRVEVLPEPGVHYTIEFIGTLKGVDPAGQPAETGNGPMPRHPGRKYSPEVGKVLSSVHGQSAQYQLSGNELYVRAAIRSDKPIPNASAGAGPLQEAWCQPVGWER